MTLCVSATVPLEAQVAEWTVTDYAVEFEIRNAGLPVVGTFAALEAEVELDPANVANSSLRGSIDPSSIETGIRFRNRHLTGRQFFDVRQFPRISMESLRITDHGPDGAIGRFRLVIRDVEREVEVPFSIAVNGDAAWLSGTLTIDRLDYDLGKPSRILADEVEIRVELDLVRAGNCGP